MHPNCEECHRLYREYRTATIEHIRLDNRLRLSALQRDYGVMEQLTRDVEAAEKKRNALREAVAEHASKPHPESATAE